MDLSFFKNKNIFITGHTGFKGAWLCKILLLSGAKVTGYSLEPPTQPNLFELMKLSGLKTITADIRNLNQLKESINNCLPEIVFHMAAQPIVRESYVNPVYTYETNVMGTVNVLEACRYAESVKSIVIITTDKVYENKEWAWSYRENENLCGFDPYSSSKSCSELVTYSYKNAFFNKKDSPAISTVRSGNVIGGGDFASDRIIPDCVRAAARQEVIIVRNPFSVRPYQHVLDTLFGYLILAKRQYENKLIAGSYNFGPNEDGCITTGELTELFCNVWGDGLSWKNVHDNGPHEANILKLDCSKAKKALNWNPKTNIRKAVEFTAEWSKNWISKRDIIGCMDNQIQHMISERTN
jgi:CDP-glucose 4,6-dehydratase